MRFIRTICLAILTVQVTLAQDSTKVIYTDSSTIETLYFGNQSKLVQEYYNGKNLVRTTSYRSDYKTLSGDYYTDKTKHHHVGIGKFYDEDGKLRITINYDKREWFPEDTNRYPHYKLLHRMKLKADSILRTIYCNEFCEKYLKWNFGYYFSKTYSDPSFTVDWLRDDSYKYYPTEFYVVYDLKEGDRIYEEAIKVLFNNKGELLRSHKWNRNWEVHNIGLEKPGDDSCLNFNLSVADAKMKAMQYGLIITDSTKVRSYLVWKASPDTFSGHWKIYVTQEAESKVVKWKKKTREYVRVQHYQVWVFNPWTGSFMEKKKMHKVYESKSSISFISSLMEGKPRIRH